MKNLADTGGAAASEQISPPVSEGIRVDDVANNEYAIQHHFATFTLLTGCCKRRYRPTRASVSPLSTRCAYSHFLMASQFYAPWRRPI